MSDPLWILYASYAVVFGAIIGSFLNVVILRLPPKLEWQWRQEALEILGQAEEISDGPQGIAVERSNCPVCRTKINWYDNIPILSYVLLGGKCRSCKTKISKQYPLVEAFTSAMFLACFVFFGWNAYGFAMAALSATLIALAVIDARTQLLPDQITLPLLWAALLFSTTSYSPISTQSAIIGAAVGYLSLWSVYWAFKLLTGKEGMGYGDFKLMAVFGAVWGVPGIPFITFAAAISGAVVGIYLYIKYKESRPYPFGPFLVAGAFLYMFILKSILPAASV